ncbi:MAG: leucine-rich repeat domain-containing protein [Holosporales bacterium]|nr:leucine-rich repeat domain-containing protein [Holosporales bacterium]
MDKGAFSGANIKSITIPPKVKIVPEMCFAGCKNLRQVTVLPHSELTEFDPYAFSGCARSRSITNLTKITVLGDECFRGCDNLELTCSKW